MIRYEVYVLMCAFMYVVLYVFVDLYICRYAYALSLFLTVVALVQWITIQTIPTI